MSYQQRTAPRQAAGAPAVSGAEASHGRQGAAGESEGAGRGAKLCCALSAAPYQVSNLIWTCIQDKAVNACGLRQWLESMPRMSPHLSPQMCFILPACPDPLEVYTAKQKLLLASRTLTDMNLRGQLALPVQP